MAEEDKKEETPNWDSKISELEAKIASLENQGKAEKAAQLQAKLTELEKKQSSSQTPKKDDAQGAKDTGKPEILSGNQERTPQPGNNSQQQRKKLVGFW